MKRLTFFTVIIIFSLMLGQLYGQNIQCKIWNTKDYAQYPSDINVPTNIYGEKVTWNYANTDELNKKASYTAVHLTFSGMDDTSFSITTKFKNFSLKNNSTKKTIHPYAILWLGEYYDEKTDKNKYNKRYMVNNFHAKKYIVRLTPHEKYDMIFLFDSANASDSLIVDGLLKTVIGK